jgi:hypothetical protein
LVTGASSGIGEGLARSLASDGWELLVVARRAERLRALAEAYPGRVTVLAADLATEEGVAAVVAATAGRPLDLLVNNAGSGWYGALEQMEPGELRRMVMLNVVAVSELTRALVPALAERGGTVLNIASAVAYQRAPWMAVYAGTKAYVLALGESLWAELKGRVHVVTLCPAAVETSFGGEAGGALLRNTMAFDTVATVDQVVREARRAVRQRGPTHFDGMRSFGLSLAARFLPRAWAARLGVQIFRQRPRAAVSGARGMGGTT